jgi:hypothetical protein
MSLWVHLAWTMAIFYCLGSYLLCGWSLFFSSHNRLQEARQQVNVFIVMFFWIFSPIIMLDVLCERLTGRRVL